MKLTDRMILDYLHKQYSIKSTKHIGNFGKLKGPLRYEREIRPEGGWVYVAQNASEFSAEAYLPTDAFFIVAGGEELPGEAGGILLGSPKSAKEQGRDLSAASVMNSVRRGFDYYEEWQERLGKLQMEQGTLQELLQTSLSVFGNPLMVVGSDFSLQFLASTAPIPEEYRFFHRESMEEGGIFREEEASAAGEDGKDVCRILKDSAGHRAVCMDIREENQPSYRLMVMEYISPIRAVTRDLLEILGSYVQYSLYHRVSGDRKKSENLQRTFQRILTDRSFNYLEASQKLSGIGWQRDQEYLCLVYQITYLDQRNFTSAAICSYMEEHFTECCSFPFQDDIVTFFNLSLLGMSLEEVAEKLMPFIRDSFLKAGYSRVMKGHMNLRRQYVQAALALDVGSRKNPYQWIHQFNEISMTYILEQITRKLPGSMLCHEKLLVLKEMDECNGTEYMKTLKTYLDLHQNAVQSARELFIHRSTFLYRLDRIKKVLESDLCDREELLYLQISFRLLEQEEKRA